MGILRSALSIAFLKIHSKSYSMAFNDNYSTKSSNLALLLEKKQMLMKLSKFSSEFPRLKGFSLITCINFHSHTHVLPSQLYSCI